MFLLLNFLHYIKSELFQKYFFSKCDQVRRKLRNWSHLLKRSLTENFIFCAVFKGYEKVREN